jgi:hypothetical protein
MAAPLLEAFDFLYMPSRDVANDLAFYANVLGARVIFAIEAFNARVAEIRFTEVVLAYCSPITCTAKRRHSSTGSQTWTPH